MTEAEWLTATDPTPMLAFLRDKVSDRKLRLFSIACCRWMWHVLPRKCRRAVETNERYADGEVTEERLGHVSFHARIAARTEHRREATAVGWAMWAAAEACGPGIGAIPVAELVVSSRVGSDNPDGRANVKREQVSLLHDIFNPFRPVTADPRWLTSAVVGLAQAIYDVRAFDRMPILADALEDAGCGNPDVLNHCRQPGEHVRGCWVVDLLTGRA